MAYLTTSSPPPTQHRSGSRRTGTEWPLAEFPDLTRLSDTGEDSCGTWLILMHTTLAWVFKDTECRASCWVCLCRHSNSYALAHLRGHNPCPEARTRLLPEAKSLILICTRAGELTHLGTACILYMEVPGFGYKRNRLWKVSRLLYSWTTPAWFSPSQLWSKYPELRGTADVGMV